MGIQRFGYRMKTYATHVTLGSTGNESQNSIAIIDGPGLAHYIYYELCDSPSTITYQGCVNATVDWLNRLQKYGFKIDAILFDGALPASKKDIRINRLQNYIGRLQAFKQSSRTKVSALSGEAKKSLPPPPFLVFAIVEELLQSLFADMTYVIPGEADPYCVAAAQALPGDDQIAIFSDDADLIVYEASQSTRIVPFRDLSETNTGSEWVLKGDEYRPSEIVKRSNSTAKDLISAAFFMSRDLYCSLEKAFRMAVETDSTRQAELTEFAGAFEVREEVQQLALIRGDPAVKSGIASRDSRVSELVHQLQTHAEGEDRSGLRLYLPFLSDDPSRATAWNVGAEIRLLAYTVLLKGHGADASVQEYRRSGARVASTLIETLSATQLNGELDKFVCELASSARDERLEEMDSWRFLAMKLVLGHLQREDYSLPSLDDAVHIVMNREARKWHLVHLSAQYQAAYYSLRMLNQVLAYTLTGRETSAGSSEAVLHGRLSGVPKISAFFNDKKSDDRKQEQEVWRETFRSLILPPSVEEEVEEDHRSIKRRKKTKQKPENASLAKNPFAMLAD